MLKLSILIIQSTILLILGLVIVNYASDTRELEKKLIRLDVTDYYIAETAVRVRHYVVPHTKVMIYCPECGLVQKPNTMELKKSNYIE